MYRYGYGAGRAKPAPKWFMAPAYKGMAAALDFNNDRYALPQLGAELCPDGTFDGGLGSFVNTSAGTGTAVLSGGLVTLTATDGTNRGMISRTFSMEAGRLYAVSFDQGAGTTLTLDVNAGAVYSAPSGAGPRTYYLTSPASGSVTLRWRINGNAGTNTIDNVSCKEVRLFDYGPELVANGGFDTNLNGHSIVIGGTSTVVWSSGRAVLTADGANAANLDRSIATVAGKLYELSVESVSLTGGGYALQVGTSLGATDVLAIGSQTAIGNRIFQFRAVGATTWVRTRKDGVAGAWTIDNVSVKEITPAALRPATRDEVFAQYTASSTTARTYVDATGTLKSDLLANAARFDWTNGKRQLLLENQATNSIRHNSMSTVVAGSPGTMPSNVSLFLGSGLVREVVGTRQKNGLTYCGVRITGATAALEVQGILMQLEGNAAITAAPGQTWALTSYIEFEGSTAGVSNPRLNIQEYSTVWLAESSTPFAFTNGRRDHIRTLTNAATTSIRPFLMLTTAAGVAVDITIWFAAHQCEQSSFASSSIATNGAAVTRAIETFRLSALLEAIIQRAEGGTIVRGQQKRKGVAIGGGVDWGTLIGYYDGRVVSTGVGGDITDWSGVHDPLLPFRAGVAWDASGRVLTGNGRAPVTDALQPQSRASVQLARNTTNNPPYGDGWYDFLGVLAFKPTGAKLQEMVG